jgi:hypothetical protein
MWMLGVMYAPTDRVTLMGTLPIRNLSMDHLTRTDVEFTTEAAGLGDISLSALVGLYDENRQRVHLNAGLRLPTGSIKRTGATPAGADSPLPYPMQLGSGTWDLEPGVTYLGQGDDWSWGAQMHGTFRLGENARNYALGQRIEATAWGARVVSDTASLSARLALSRIGNIDGADEVLDPAMVPTADPIRRAGRRFDLAFGINIYAHGGAVDGHRLAIEVVWPLYQSLDGPQLETDWAITIGWQKAWAVAR